MTSQLIRSLPLVALGGAAGAAAREALILGMPATGSLPWAIIVANIAGAFLLGLLYAGLDRPGGPGRQVAPNSPGVASHTVLLRNRRLRLLLGTGFCGGFTTYSTLAVGVLLLAGSSGVVWAAAYAAGTVFVGALATWAGIALGIGSSAGPHQHPTLRRGQQP
ncbi:hypothetical protein ART_0082 [Arthrobacter sp. PAMC 25486]|uniref:fluoride efflux transporter FluC n=1 Tax=Arthrobacter sp. PAMC 25486 TaxID=1494608 RepID=UPI0005364070|nr:CrcB family protein [Arthrobacter sp. PAMC 25486]AIX99680.1 hypothetical protein ART_0082 [Arthrobacter sp. PAMC 25486]